MGWSMRDAVPGDLPAILALERALFPEDAWPEELLRSELAQPAGRYLAATSDDGSVVGYAGLSVAAAFVGTSLRQTIPLPAIVRGRAS